MAINRKIDTNWERNKEVFEVLKRHQSINKSKWDKNLLRRLLVKSKIVFPELIKEETLMKRLPNSSLYDQEFLIGNPESYQNGEWKDTGYREGYDKGIIIYSRSMPEYFAPFWIPSKKSYVIDLGPHENPKEYKKERDLSQKVVETLNKKEVEELMDKGFRLIKKDKVKLVEISPSDGESALGWSYTPITEDLYTLAKK